MVKAYSTETLRELLGTPGTVLLDVRPMAAYNGWRLRGEARGGHIPGARACPLAWVERLTPDEARRLGTLKGLDQAERVIIYGYDRQEAEAMAAHLAALGYADPGVYPSGQPTWAAHAELPLSRLPRYHKLVHPAWVAELVGGGAPETYEGNGFQLFHVNFGVPEEYAAGHLPGAVYLDTNALESVEDWNRRSPEELREAVLANGITAGLTVVLYGRDTEASPEGRPPGSRAGQIAAMRAAAVLMYAGVEDVRLLDGGYDAWLESGYPVVTEPVPASAAQDFGAPIPAHPEYFVDLEGAKELLAAPDGLLVSIRTWSEFIGETSGYNYIMPAGRIAGAVWGNCGTDAYHMEHYRNVDNTMRDFHEIAANWRMADITPEKKVAFYCGTGWRASETFFYAHLMGWDRVSVYDGGWLEWSRDPANPVERGMPADECAPPVPGQVDWIR